MHVNELTKLAHSTRVVTVQSCILVVLRSTCQVTFGWSIQNALMQAIILALYRMKHLLSTLFLYILQYPCLKAKRGFQSIYITIWSTSFWSKRTAGQLSFASHVYPYPVRFDNDMPAFSILFTFTFWSMIRQKSVHHLYSLDQYLLGFARAFLLLLPHKLYSSWVVANAGESTVCKDLHMHKAATIHVGLNFKRLVYKFVQ